MHYTAEFVPAVALKGVSFESSANEIQRVVEGGFDDGSSVSTSDEEREHVPEGVTASLPMGASIEEYLEEASPTSPKSQTSSNGNASLKKHKKNNMSIDSAMTTGTVKTSETAETGRTTNTDSSVNVPGVEMTKDELLSHRKSLHCLCCVMNLITPLLINRVWGDRL